MSRAGGARVGGRTVQNGSLVMRDSSGSSPQLGATLPTPIMSLLRTPLLRTPVAALRRDNTPHAVEDNDDDWSDCSLYTPRQPLEENHASPVTPRVAIALDQICGGIGSAGLRRPDRIDRTDWGEVKVDTRTTGDRQVEGMNGSRAVDGNRLQGRTIAHDDARWGGNGSNVYDWEKWIVGGITPPPPLYVDPSIKARLSRPSALVLRHTLTSTNAARRSKMQGHNMGESSPRPSPRRSPRPSPQYSPQQSVAPGVAPGLLEQLRIGVWLEKGIVPLPALGGAIRGAMGPSRKEQFRPCFCRVAVSPPPPVSSQGYSQEPALASPPIAGRIDGVHETYNTHIHVSRRGNVTHTRPPPPPPPPPPPTTIIGADTCFLEWSIHTRSSAATSHSPSSPASPRRRRRGRGTDHLGSPAEAAAGRRGGGFWTRVPFSVITAVKLVRQGDDVDDVDDADGDGGENHTTDYRRFRGDTADNIDVRSAPPAEAALRRVAVHVMMDAPPFRVVFHSNSAAEAEAFAAGVVLCSNQFRLGECPHTPSSTCMGL